MGECLAGEYVEEREIGRLRLSAENCVSDFLIYPYSSDRSLCQRPRWTLSNVVSVCF